MVPCPMELQGRQLHPIYFVSCSIANSVGFSTGWVIQVIVGKALHARYCVLLSHWGGFLTVPFKVQENELTPERLVNFNVDPGLYDVDA